MPWIIGLVVFGVGGLLAWRSGLLGSSTVGTQPAALPAPTGLNDPFYTGAPGGGASVNPYFYVPPPAAPGSGGGSSDPGGDPGSGGGGLTAPIQYITLAFGTINVDLYANGTAVFTPPSGAQWAGMNNFGTASSPPPTSGSDPVTVTQGDVAAADGSIAGYSTTAMWQSNGGPVQQTLVVFANGSA